MSGARNRAPLIFYRAADLTAYTIPTTYISADFEDGSVAGFTTLSAATAANVTAYASGGTHALHVTSVAGLAEHYVEGDLGPSIADGTVLRLTCDVRAGTVSWVYIAEVGATNYNAYSFNVSAGSVGNTRIPAGQQIAASITALGNNWWRCSFTFIRSGSGQGHIRLEPLATNGVYLYTAAGTEDAYFDNVLLQASPLTAQPVSQVRPARTLASARSLGNAAALYDTALYGSGFYGGSNGVAPSTTRAIAQTLSRAPIVHPAIATSGVPALTLHQTLTTQVVQATAGVKAFTRMLPVAPVQPVIATTITLLQAISRSVIAQTLPQASIARLFAPRRTGAVQPTIQDSLNTAQPLSAKSVTTQPDQATSAVRVQGLHTTSSTQPLQATTLSHTPTIVLRIVDALTFTERVVRHLATPFTRTSQDLTVTQQQHDQDVQIAGPS